MIVQRYVFREIALSLLGVTLILLLITFSGTFVRILSETVAGKYSSDIMFSMLGVKVVGGLKLVFPLSFFLAVVLALGRLYKDSEMTAMLACGIRPLLVVRVAGVAGVLGALFVASLAFYFGPAAEAYGMHLMDQVAAKSEIEGIQPGQFNPADEGGLIYVESMSADGLTLHNVFAYTVQKGVRHLVSAKSAYQIREKDGDRYLVLVDGYRYDGDPTRPGFKVVQFKKHGLRIAEREVVASQATSDSVDTLTLLRSKQRGDRAELQWRIAMPISTLLLGLLAVPLAKSSPRQGRYNKLFAGLLLYITYYNLLQVGRSWLLKGKVPPEVGLWWVHLIVLAVVVVLVVRLEGVRTPRLPWRPA